MRNMNISTPRRNKRNGSRKEVYNVMKDMVEKDQQQFMHLLFEKDLVPKFAKQMNAPKVETNMLQNKPTMEASKVPG